MHISTAKLLDTVAYAMRKPCKAQNLMGNEITVIDTFPYNPESKTSPETAKHWAEGYSWNNENADPAEYLTRDNEPFVVSITDLDVRTEGGRAYKVIDPENRRFDLREDQVLEVMKRCGVKPGGDIPGLFCWGVWGSQLRLVLVGGELHQAMLDQTLKLKDLERRKQIGDAGILTPSKLQVGHVYKKRDGKRTAFVGRVKVPEIDKASYAFYDYDLPTDEVPKRWNRDMSEYLPIVEGWDKMSMNERLVWMRENGHSTYRPILILQSPKVDEWTDTGDSIEVAFYRDNTDCHCFYRSGHGEDIAEARWEKQNGGRRSYHDHSNTNNWRLGRDEMDRHHKEFHNKQVAAALQTRREFRDGLVWL